MEQFLLTVPPGVKLQAAYCYAVSSLSEMAAGGLAYEMGSFSWLCSSMLEWLAGCAVENG